MTLAPAAKGTRKKGKEFQILGLKRIHKRLSWSCVVIVGVVFAVVFTVAVKHVLYFCQDFLPFSFRRYRLVWLESIRRRFNLSSLATSLDQGLEASALTLQPDPVKKIIKQCQQDKEQWQDSKKQVHGGGDLDDFTYCRFTSCSGSWANVFPLIRIAC